MIDRQPEHFRVVAWMRRISARSGLNVVTAMPTPDLTGLLDPGHPRKHSSQRSTVSMNARFREP
jgi:hypothetical protein